MDLQPEWAACLRFTMFRARGPGLWRWVTMCLPCFIESSGRSSPTFSPWKKRDFAFCRPESTQVSSTWPGTCSTQSHIPPLSLSPPSPTLERAPSPFCEAKIGGTAYENFCFQLPNWVTVKGFWTSRFKGFKLSLMLGLCLFLKHICLFFFFEVDS